MKDPLEESGVDVKRGVATRLLLVFIAGLVGLFVFVPGSRIPLAIVIGIVIMVMLHEAGHYIMAKRANHLRVQAEAIAWGKRGARVNSISPGIVATPLAQHELNSPIGSARENGKSAPSSTSGVPRSTVTSAVSR